MDPFTISLGLGAVSSVAKWYSTYKSEQKQGARQMEEELDQQELFQKNAELAERSGLEKVKLHEIEETKRLGDMRSAMASSGMRSDSVMYGLGQQMEMAENERRSIMRNALEEKDRHLMSRKWSKNRYAGAKDRVNDAWKTGFFSSIDAISDTAQNYARHKMGGK